MEDNLDFCPECKAPYTHGCALYKFYSCGHAWQKPLNNSEKGKLVYFPSPYLKKE